MLLETMNLDNVRNASTLSLLRARSRDFYAKFGRYIIARYPEDKEQFSWCPPEGRGSVVDRERVLWGYIESEMRQIQNIHREVMGWKEWRDRYIPLNQSGGELVKRQRLLHQEIVKELPYRLHPDDIAQRFPTQLPLLLALRRTIALPAKKLVTFAVRQLVVVRNTRTSTMKTLLSVNKEQRI